MDNKTFNKVLIDLCLWSVDFTGILSKNFCCVLCPASSQRDLYVCVCVHGCVCALRAGVFSPLLKQCSQAAAHSGSTVRTAVLSMLLCAHRQLFPLALSIEGRAGCGRNMPPDAHSCLCARPLTCACVCVPSARPSHAQDHGPEQ